MGEPTFFPPFIRALPEPDAPLGGASARILQTGEALALFYELPDGGLIPEHAHGAQWGVVLAGRIDFTIGDATRTLRPGDTYLIEAGVPHSAVIHPGTAGIDTFADADRYRPRGRPPAQHAGPADLEESRS